MNEELNELGQMRHEAGVTQEQLARLLGLSAKTPYNWEHLAPAKVKPFHRISYRVAIEAALEGALIARFADVA